jgi:hypothetical protein
VILSSNTFIASREALHHGAKVDVCFGTATHTGAYRVTELGEGLGKGVFKIRG